MQILANAFDFDEKAKAKFQVFTPRAIVQSMLDLAGYNENIVGKKILENSFGQGAFLEEIVTRYIKCSLDMGLSPNLISKLLARDIVGYEINGESVSHVKDVLNGIAAKYGIRGVQWDLRMADALFDNRHESFSWVVGNPPYLEYKAIAPDYRSRLKSSFETCSRGKFDYCYAFLESSCHKLEKGGVLVQLVPGSIFKNVYADKLRSLLKPGITHIVDYSGERVFGSALVSPCVLRFVEEEHTSSFLYRRSANRAWSVINKDDLSSKWTFAPSKTLVDSSSFGERFHASMPVATLLNDAFLLTDIADVERDVVREAASPRVVRSGKPCFILFPYAMREDGSLGRYNADAFREKYPKATAHLEKYRNLLMKRKTDKSIRWFEYGRNQALKLVAQRKLLVSTVITGKVLVYELKENVVPFSGIVITASSLDSDLDEAKKILESDAFYDYAQSVGTSVNGSSVRITCKDVNEFKYHL